MNSRSSVLMMPLSAVFKAITQARSAAYRRGFFRSSALPAPVISVGNITTGGTGKTPLVEWVCRAINDETGDSIDRKSICVLTRGYGKSNPNAQVVVSNANEILAGVREAGDEALLLARNLLGTATVIANPNRIAAGEWAMRNLASEVFVLDDGFQHLRLERNLDIVTIDATNPFGGGEMLPSGRLREPLTSLSRADCVVITRCDQIDNLAAVERVVREFVGGRPVFVSRMITKGFVRIDSEQGGAAFPITGSAVVAFCGLGNAAGFFRQAADTGLHIALSRSYPDHYNYTQRDIDVLIEEARASGSTALITTAKDATKLERLDIGLPCYSMEIEISIQDEERLTQLIQSRICNADLRHPAG